MKKHFNLTLTTAIATALAACGSSHRGEWDDDYAQYTDRDTAVCVDRRTDQRLPDSACDRRAGGAYWYYLGRNRVVPYYDDHVSGGTYTRPTGRTYYRAPSTTSMSRSAAVSRGGFGSTGRSSFYSSGS